MNTTQIVEAILFASHAPLGASEIARADPELDEDDVETAVQELRRMYDENGRAFQVMEIAEGYQILTRPEFAPYLERFDTVPRPSRLSGPALEALAIIAYRQPIGRLDVEYIRGVNSSGVVRTLQDRGLIEVVGRAEGLGRPLLYGTTQRFLEHFAFNSLEDLPRPEDLPVVLRERVPLGPENGAPPKKEGSTEPDPALDLKSNVDGTDTAEPEVSLDPGGSSAADVAPGPIPVEAEPNGDPDLFESPGAEIRDQETGPGDILPF